MSKESFEFNALHGSMFPGSAESGTWAGNWAEEDGSGTHKIKLQKVDGEYVVSFCKFGGKSWTHAVIEFAAEGEELATRNHKGFVVFKGHTLNIWLNYAKGHDGDSDYARYDLKPAGKKAAPLF